MVTQKQIQKITEIIVQTVQPAKVYLIGSYSKGVADKESDIDFLIISKDEKIPKFGRTANIREKLWGVANVAIDLSMFTPKEIEQRKERKFSFINNALKSGKILYEA